MSSMVDSFEKIPCEIFANTKQGSAFVAFEIAKLIREKACCGPAMCSWACNRIYAN